ncbi:MAG: hypothetical protein A3F54_00690 [Candidatus Kerfeldbacteria bacterium RIFCSPHIGHO2_12_FULL_48_17]|uniref:Type II secretion system protein J n=1 Tax=Candidatus Kerfeldbacteria bacterium RIFCSPHIGHO2_12_FULL_48_17 TaxID=1798542 RepID=A0A1G2B5J6_9BACT|nr:MAG: hypothetical protein A3F54_00690 [Candidatus Kerfeldbacteria bacterium RIFCSPHIGHO2_12_FULL_48_17]
MKNDPQQQRQQRQQGFSLIEIIITLAIFSIVSLVAIDVFLLVSKNQDRFTSQQTVEDDSRFVITQLTRNIQAGEIDYDFYNAVAEIDIADATGRGVLALRDKAGQQIVYRRASVDPTKPWQGGGQTLEVCFAGCELPGADWENLTSIEVKVIDAQFWVHPVVSPWQAESDGSYAVNTQPYVTVMYGVQGKNDSNQENTIQLQTTVVSRFYQR